MKSYKKGKPRFRNKIKTRKSMNIKKMYGGGVKIKNFLTPNKGTYQGELVDDKREGKGNFRYEDNHNYGDIYKGEWKNNKRDGKGLFKTADGDRYEGEWKEDKKHGHGKMTWKTTANEGDSYHRDNEGVIYEGEWQMDIIWGQGKMVYSSGDVYDGHWNAGERDGTGIMVFTNGYVYNGEWKDNHIVPLPTIKDIRQDTSNINTNMYLRTNDNIDILNTISTSINVNPAGDSYEGITNIIYQLIKINLFCKQSVDEDYILFSFMEIDAIIVIQSPDVSGMVQYLGFALITFIADKNTLTIETICSNSEYKGAGDYLMQKLEELARALSKKYIRLNSVGTAITFYEKYGFVKEKASCTHLCTMTKTL